MDEFQEEIEFVEKVLNHKAGFNLNLFGMMSIWATDQLTWEVSWKEIVEDENEKCPHQVKRFCSCGKIETNYKSFTSLKEAATFFVAKRREDQLGIDFEKELFSKLANNII